MEWYSAARWPVEVSVGRSDGLTIDAHGRDDRALALAQSVASDLASYGFGCQQIHYPKETYVFWGFTPGDRVVVDAPEEWLATHSGMLTHVTGNVYIVYGRSLNYLIRPNTPMGNVIELTSEVRFTLA